jgi:sec-independent protein translocase protein TatA
MGAFSITHLLILLAIVLLVFGAGRLPNVMGDFAKGIKAFKKGMRDEDVLETPTPTKPLEQQSVSADPLHTGRNPG